MHAWAIGITVSVVHYEEESPFLCTLRDVSQAFSILIGFWVVLYSCFMSKHLQLRSTDGASRYAVTAAAGGPSTPLDNVYIQFEARLFRV